VALHLRLGKSGEHEAEMRLKAKGYRVLTRNYATKSGEVDLICEDNGTIVFVEVKTRGPGSLAAPADAVHGKKRTRLIKAASRYLSENDLWNRPCRFDVVTALTAEKGFTIEHIENAFGLEAGSGMYQPF
jgi:putative endonuclease